MKYSNVLLMSILALAACKPTPSSPVSAKPADTTLAHLKSAYARSAEYDDINVAAGLAYQLIEADPEFAGKWKEELAKIYFASQRQVSCQNVCDDLIKNHEGGSKLPILEMRALGLEALGKKPEATAAWQQAWDKSQSATHALRLAGLFFDSDKLTETDQTITAGLSAKDIETASIALPKSRDEMQTVPAAAALHNLKALLLSKRYPDQKDAIKAELDAALALAPEFELAKRNLASFK